MRIVLLADLHYGNGAHEGSGPFAKDEHKELADEVDALKPDVLVVAGDVAETIIDKRLLAEALGVYRNSHGASLMLPGNHDVWCEDGYWPSGLSGAEAKYEWNLETAEKNGWFVLSDTPFFPGVGAALKTSGHDVVIAGNMGWYDFSSSPVELGLTPQIYEKKRAWSDYAYMGLRNDPEPMPMMEFCRRRMSEFRRGMAAVPKDRKALVVVTHIVGFEDLLGPLRDANTAYFGNFDIGRMVEQAGADLYCCGHTHARAESKHGGTRCVNNGSQYGSGTKRYDVFDF